MASAEVRTSMADRDGFAGEVRDLFDDRQDLRCLFYALLMLDDEPVVVLHRPTRTGYRVRLSGIGDNFQLHTLLAGALIGKGRIPGTPPKASWVAGSSVAPLTRQLMSETVVGSFNLVAPDGTWIWNEGTPSDIPVVGGTRLLVLDPPPYQRGWNNVRFFPMIHGSVVLEDRLGAEETQRWFAHVTEPKGVVAPQGAAPRAAKAKRFGFFGRG